MFVASALHPTHGSHRAPHTTHPHHKVRSNARARDPRCTDHGGGHWTRAPVNGPNAQVKQPFLQRRRVVFNSYAFFAIKRGPGDVDAI